MRWARPAIPTYLELVDRALSPPEALIVDPQRPQPYRLRLARYAVLAQDIDEWTAAAAKQGRPLAVLDVGCGWGILLRHLETMPHFAGMTISAADLQDIRGYKPELYQDYFLGDLTAGYQEIASESYDVVVCEQVLEHLGGLDAALATLARLVRPGGRLVIGVPIFLPPLHLVRRFLVPLLGGLFGHTEAGGHQQAFSLYSFRRLLCLIPGLRIEQVRGFRIISGGVLRPLEYYRWWWLLNRRLGQIVPALCIEAQFILRKVAKP